MHRTRVLIVFSSGEIGGAERTLTRMVCAARGEDVEYRLATCGEGETWRDWATQLGLAAKAFPIFARRGLRVREIVRLVRHLRRERPHVVYAIGIRAAVLLRALRPFLPQCVFVHGIRSSFPPGTRLARRMRASERIFGWMTDHYVANSRAGADTLSRIAGIPQDKISVVHNGVEPVSFAAAPLGHRPPRVAVVANLNRYKGHVAFLDVVEGVRHAIPDVEVWFIGRDDSDGEVMREVERRGLSDVVRACGFVASPYALVASARVFALPSTQIEGCPTAVLEALMLGVPVVAFQVGGVPEIVKSGVTGTLVPPGRVNEFAEALIRLLQDQELNERYSAAARADAAARFSLAECASRHDAVFQRLRNAVEDR